MIAAALCLFTYLQIVEAKDFIMLSTGVFGYYFGTRGNTSTPTA